MKIILFEGTDYSGKTSVAKALAARDQTGTYYHSPSGSTDTTHALYEILKSDAPDINVDVKLLLMLAANVLGINAMNSLKMVHNQNVYADRSILSMLVYQSVPIVMYNDLSKIFTIPTLDVDHVFLFTADTETLMHRFRTRTNKDNLDDFFMKHLYDICKRYQDLTTYIYPKEKVTVVDTSNRTVEDTIEYCAGVIKS